MNHITQLNNLQQRLKSFKEFMPICPNKKVNALSHEMTKLLARIDKLNSMDFVEMTKEVEFYYETKQSSINF